MWKYFIICPNCGNNINLWHDEDSNPMYLNDMENTCPHCQKEYNITIVSAVQETSRVLRK